MTRKRRGGMPSTPSERIARYEIKVDPDIIKTYIQKEKELMVQKEREYQPIHVMLTELVRDVVTKYGVESTRLQGYMWYAQGVWYCTVHYSSLALTKCVVMKFLEAKMRDLNEECLRIIARRLGVEIPDWDVIVKIFLKAEIVLGKAATVWGIPLVELNKTLPIYIQAEESGMNIVVKIVKPDGRTEEKKAEDLGDGNYKVEITFDQPGPWLIEVIYPDGFRRKKLVYVS